MSQNRQFTQFQLIFMNPHSDRWILCISFILPFLFTCQYRQWEVRSGQTLLSLLNILFIQENSILEIMGQTCKDPCQDIVPGLPLQKGSLNICETASFQQKSEPDSPFSHLSATVSSKLSEINYQPHQLKAILAHPVLQLPNGVSYQGLLENNQMGGACRLAMPDGSYFQGTMAHNRLNGEGLLIDAKGEYYIGTFKDNKAEGEGIYVGEDFIYEGSFKKNVYSGKGKLTKANEIFEGVFEKGKMKRGKLTKLAEQSVYEGEFQGNIENGLGKLSREGSTYEGIFKNGLLEGEGQVKEEDGSGSVCVFERGVMVSILRLTLTEGEGKQSAQFFSLRDTRKQDS